MNGLFAHRYLCSHLSASVYVKHVHLNSVQARFIIDFLSILVVPSYCSDSCTRYDKNCIRATWRRQVRIRPSVYMQIHYVKLNIALLTSHGRGHCYKWSVLKGGDLVELKSAWVQTRTPVSRFEFTWIDLALNWLLANQPVASEFLRAAVTPLFNVSFSCPVSRLKSFNLIYCYRELIVGIVVSDIAIFRLVDSDLSSSLHC